MRIEIMSDKNHKISQSVIDVFVHKLTEECLPSSLMLWLDYVREATQKLNAKHKD